MSCRSQLRYFSHSVVITTSGRRLLAIEPQIAQVIQQSDIHCGQCTLFLHHTSASLILCENADPQVLQDLANFFARLVPDGDPLLKHKAEGPDDMPAHIRTILTQNSLTIPITEGHLDLGTWQGIFIWEHRTSAHQRRMTVSLIGERKSEESSR